jgi:predicted nucleotide-binding protein
MDLKDKAQNAINTLENQRSLLDQIHNNYRNEGHDFSWEKLERWKNRTTRKITDLINQEEGIKFSQREPTLIMGDPGGSFQYTYEEYKGHINVIIDELHNYPEEIFSTETYEEPPISPAKSSQTNSPNKVFVVHGHDETLKHETEAYLYREGFHPIILHRQLDEGQTVIEKFEKNSDVGYALILLTPDDLGFPKTEREKIQADPNYKFQEEFRARQNVIFEWGYFVGKLGRPNVCCILKQPVIIPSDLNGIVDKRIENSIEEKGYEIIKEMTHAGLTPKKGS